MLDEAVLLTSELCTNALQHTDSGAGGTFEVTVLRGPGSRGSKYATKAPSPSRPQETAEQLAEDGRGLEIVRLLAYRWGQRGDEYGRCVFFELRCDCP